MDFQGFVRTDGLVGVRNKVLVMATSDCAEPTARMIVQGFKDAVSITQHLGCIAIETAPTLTGVAKNSNIAAVLVVSMGCEGIEPEPIMSEVSKAGKDVELVKIQEIGTTRQTIARGREILQRMLEKACKQKREPFNLGRLAIGLKCGGSDTTSGIAANPAIGVMADMMVDAGASVVMIEPIEAIGAEEYLSHRAVNEEVRRAILKWISDEEKRWTIPGASVDFMCRGNIDGGLTTLEEKALGAVHKGGHRPIQGVLKNRRDYLETVPRQGGFYLQEGTHEEIPAITYMAAAGVNIIVFATGRGGVFGHAICPVIRVTGNPETWAKMNEDMDVNASTAMEGNESIESVGKRIFDEVVAVASGKLTKSEQMGFDNFALWRYDSRLEALLGLL
ncbi:MAG TPA: UxaA family hydrolase [Dehalococcoidia bacterium]|nr:UxaA family hydrolase [Dehalococcoidia bacterium]